MDLCQAYCKIQRDMTQFRMSPALFLITVPHVRLHNRLSVRGEAVRGSREDETGHEEPWGCVCSSASLPSTPHLRAAACRYSVLSYLIRLPCLSHPTLGSPTYRCYTCRLLPPCTLHPFACLGSTYPISVILAVPCIHPPLLSLSLLPLPVRLHLFLTIRTVLFTVRYFLWNWRLWNEINMYNFKKLERKSKIARRLYNNLLKGKYKKRLQKFLMKENICKNHTADFK